MPLKEGALVLAIGGRSSSKSKWGSWDLGGNSTSKDGIPISLFAVADRSIASLQRLRQARRHLLRCVRDLEQRRRVAFGVELHLQIVVVTLAEHFLGAGVSLR